MEKGVLMNQAGMYFTDKLLEAQDKPALSPSLININYTVDREGYVTVKIYDLQGIEIAELVHELKLPGNYSIIWDTKDVRDKVYIVHTTIISDRFRFASAKKLVLS